jgi:hypothetical protein
LQFICDATVANPIFMRQFLCLLFGLTTAAKLAASPGIGFQLDQTPVTGPDAITKVLGDAHDCYTYNFNSANNSGTPVNCNYNQKLFSTNSIPWFNLPWGQLPNWYDSTATNPSTGSTARYWTNWVPVIKAFRTAGVVRGSTPFALVVDDIQKDNASHAYDWRMILANDLTAASNATFTVSGNDCIITPPTGNAKCLVRVLASASTPVFVTTNNIAGQPMLDILETNVAPDFKILLLPFTNATPPITTTWSNNLLTVTMSDGQTDHIYFTTNADGRTRLAQYRIAGIGAVPAIPSLTATAGVAQVSLNWNSSPGATGYNLKASTTNGGPFGIIAANFGGTNFTQTNLLPGTNYFYVVSALNTNGESKKFRASQRRSARCAVVSASHRRHQLVRH